MLKMSHVYTVKILRDKSKTVGRKVETQGKAVYWAGEDDVDAAEIAITNARRDCLHDGISRIVMYEIDRGKPVHLYRCLIDDDGHFWDKVYRGLGTLRQMRRVLHSEGY